MKKQYKSMIAFSLSVGLTCSLMTPIAAYEKEETVYVTLNEDGNVQDVIVGDHLISEGEKQIHDTSDLRNIQNVNGDESFKQNDESIVWDNQGHDIYFEGTTSKELPLQMDITYSFNGKKMLPKEMEGKEGSIEIQIHLNNLDKHDDLYTPFVVTLASVLPAHNNSEINVTNGKAISNGKNNVIVAVAAPGLYDSLDRNETLKDFDTITIRYNTKKFETMPIYAMATPKLLEESDLDFDHRFNEISHQLLKLQDASSQLVNGSHDLASGSGQLSSKYQQFDQGLSQLSKGTGTLSKQYQTLNNGIQSLVEQSQSFQSITSMLDQLSSLDSATQALDKGILTLKKAVEASADPNSEINQKINALQTDLVAKQQEILTLQTSMKQLQIQLQTRVQSLISISKQMKEAIQEAPDDQKSTFQAINDQLDGEIFELTNNLQQLAQGMSLLETNLTIIHQDMNDLNTLSKQISAGTLNKINQAVEAFSKGNEQLKQGLAMIQKQSSNLPNLFNQFVAGTQQLGKGSTQVNEALAYMHQSTNTLYQASTQINQAIHKLNHGATALHKGMLQFDRDGIQNISSLSTILKNAGNKADRLAQLSKNYTTFTKTDKNIQSDVKFIFTVQFDENK